MAESHAQSQRSHEGTFLTSIGPIAYDSNGAGNPIVLLPSGGHSRRDYDELRGIVSRRFSTIALDWPGHGDSPSGSAPAAELQLARITEEFLQAVTPAGAVLVGNSVGGNVAARLAIHRPDLVKGLVIIDGGGFEGSRRSGRIFVSLMSRPWFARRIYPTFSRSYMCEKTDADKRARADAIAITRTVAGVRAVTEIWHSFGLAEHDLQDKASEIRAPTLVVWGRHDPVLTLSAGENAHALIPESKLVIVDSGHLPHTTDPATVAAELMPLAAASFGRHTRREAGSPISEQAEEPR